MKKKLLCALLAGASGTLFAEVVVGVSVSSTGPGASLGVQVANTIALLPKSIGGETVRYVVMRAIRRRGRRTHAGLRAKTTST
jgi:branched-chain amino acid transport system substrate-binding protein